MDISGQDLLYISIHQDQQVMVYIVTISKCHTFHFSGLSSTLNLGKGEQKLSNEGSKVNTYTTAQYHNELKILIFYYEGGLLNS